MPAALAKSGTVVSKKGSVVAEETAETVVEALVAATPDKRPAEATKLRAMLTEPGGSFLVWDQLGRTRKNYGSQAGLVAMVEMLNAKADKYQVAGHEPAVQCLATFCNTKEYVMIIGKMKKVLHGIMNILSDSSSSFRAKESASWVLRRTTEFCKQARAELGGDRDALQVISRLLRGDDFDTRSRLSSPEDGARRISDDQTSMVSYQNSPLPSRPVSRPQSREQSRPASRETSMNLGVIQGDLAGWGGTGSGGSRPVSGGGNGPVTPSHAATARQLEASTRQLLKEQSIGGGAKEAMSRSGPVSGLGHGLIKEGSLSRSGPVTLSGQSPSSSLRPSSLKDASKGGQLLKGQSVGLLPPPLTEGFGGSFVLDTPLSGGLGGSSRPVTSFAQTQVITFTAEPDQMCIEGNLCAALGNAAHSDEVLERLGKTEGVVLGAIHLLQYGSDWAKGHAGRTLGNLAYTPENCKFLMQVDRENNAVHALCNILAAEASQRSKEWALHAVANLSRNANLCASFNRMQGLLPLLQHLASQGIDREDVDRAIANLSQARLGTRTWRQPRKI